MLVAVAILVVVIQAVVVMESCTLRERWTRRATPGGGGEEAATALMLLPAEESRPPTGSSLALTLSVRRMTCLWQARQARMVSTREAIGGKWKGETHVVARRVTRCCRHHHATMTRPQ